MRDHGSEQRLRIHSFGKCESPVTPIYRTEDRALSCPEIDFPGLERAYRFLALFNTVEPGLDPVDEMAENLPAASGGGLPQFFAQTPQVANDGVYLASHVRWLSLTKPLLSEPLDTKDPK